MWLIDADARVTVQSFDPIDEEYNHDEMTVKQALDFATDEGCPPIIDAIPVEWLEHMIAATTLARTSNAIKDVLALWKRMGQKKQEAKNATD